MKETDRRVAARMRERPDLFPIARVPGLGTWQMHKIAMSRLPVPLVQAVPTKDEEAAWQRCYSSLVMDTIFTCNTLKGEEEGAVIAQKMVLRRNERSWRKALKTGNLPPPLSIATLNAIALEKSFVRCQVLTDVVVPLLQNVPPLGFIDFDVPEEEALWD